MTTAYSSRIAGFHKQSVAERIAQVAGIVGLDDADRALLANTGSLTPEVADHLIENMVGTMAIPVGVATNMKVDGRDVLVPMATEESSVVAAVASKTCGASTRKSSSALWRIVRSR